jgi:Putative peptidoglycan binding domain
VTTVKRIIGLAALTAVASLPRALQETHSGPQSPPVRSSDELPSPARPAAGERRALSVDEIRWCMSQEIALQAIRSKLVTPLAIARYNELAGDYNGRCGGYEASRSDRDEARQSVESARDSIVAAALDDIRRSSGEGALTRPTQELLQVLGYDPGSVDGVYGKQTEAAIRAFQRNSGLPVDGLVSDELLARLRVGLTASLRPAGRGARRETPQTVDVVVLVTDGTESVVPDAHVSISGDRQFHADGSTNDRGAVEFGAVPYGRLALDVRRNEARSRFTLRLTEERRQEILIVLPNSGGDE